MSSDLKTSFDLELNPFERSFATKDLDQVSKHEGKDGEDTNGDTKTGSSSNKHNLHIPNLSNLNGLTQKIPGITPLFLTPGGRRLPPLGLSPGGNMSIATPGGTLWNSLLNATNNSSGDNNVAIPEDQQVSYANVNGANNNINFNQMVNNSRKSGLTPKESNIRTGLTPGGMVAGGFNFNGQLMGMTTPSGLLNSPMTPGLSSLLGLTGTSQTLIPTGSGQQNGTVGAQQQAASVPIQAEQQAPETKKEASKVAENNEEKEENRKRASAAANSKNKRQKTTAGSKKRNTKREASIKEELDSEGDSNGRPSTEDEKRKHFLERNRLAASKCRQRKKQLVKKMEDELQFYSAGYRELSSQINQMREQLVTMRNVIAGHKDCPMLVNMVGGYEQLANLLRQTEYVAQVTEKSQVNMSSIPSTIPTALNASDSYSVPPAPTSNVPHQLPISDSHNSGTASVESNYNMANNSNVSSHHSMTDLTAAQHNGGAHAGGISNIQQPQASDLRTINSLSNLSALAQPKQVNMNNNINLRTINSMVDLQHNGNMLDLATHNV